MSASAIAKRDTGIVEVVPNSPTGWIVPVDDWNDERKEFIRRTFCGGAPDPIAEMFLEICRRRRLSPEARHIYLVNRSRKGDPENFVIQTGIDGYRLIADRTGRYAGSDDPAFVHDPDGRVVVATVTVRKLIGDVVGSFTASARWDEYAAGGPMWGKMPHTMLGKCAEALALRKAFPEELSGIYTDAEMDQAERDDRAPSTAPVSAPKASASVARPVSSATSGEGAMKALHAEAAKHDVSHEQLHELGVAIYGVESLAACEVQQLTAIRLAVRDCKPDDVNALMQLATVIPTTDDRAYLDDILGEAEKGRLPENARRLLAAAADRVAKTLPAVAS